MSLFTKDNFPEIKSEPDWFITWVIRVAFLLLFGSLAILLYFIPIAFYIDGTIDGGELSSFGLIYYPIILGMTYLAVRYLKRIKGNAVRHITVNRHGVFYKKLNGMVESLQYSELEKSTGPDVYDVFIGSRLIPTGETIFRQTFLNVFLKGYEQKVQVFHLDVGYSYYARNSRLLRSTFIQGIVLFRPDLRIAPNIYTEFSIHPETFEFDKKEYWKMVAIAIIFIIIVFIGIEWYMKYRFGDSLIF